MDAPTFSFKQPNANQRAAYVAALKIQNMRLRERGKGRSGYLSDELEATARAADAVIDEALASGVGFDIDELLAEAAQ